MGRRKNKETDEGAEAPKPTLGSAERPAITLEEPSVDNPSGITSVDPEHAQQLGELRGAGGPGAAGATVLGPIGFAATKGGSVPLPTKDDPEPEATGEPSNEGAPEGMTIAEAGGVSEPDSGEPEPEPEPEV